MRKYSAGIAIAAGLTLSAGLIPAAFADETTPATPTGDLATAPVQDPALAELIADAVAEDGTTPQLSPEEQEAAARANALADDSDTPASPGAVNTLRQAAEDTLRGNTSGGGSSAVTSAPAGYGYQDAIVPAEKRDYLVPPAFKDREWRGALQNYRNFLNREVRQDINGQAISADRVKEVTYHSNAMNRDIPLVVLQASKPDRPVVYLLNGAGGGEQSVNWLVQGYNNDRSTPIIHHYMQQDVNLVIPMRGAFSYYTDWVKPANGNAYLRGPQYWETFLTKELPGAIESQDLNQTDFDATKRAIIGMSMSATSSLLLAQHSGDLYSSVGSFSGCAATSKPFPWAFMALTIDRGGESPETMWGKAGSDVNVWNDALIQSEKLRGKAVYVSNGSGLTSGRELASTQRDRGIAPAQAFATSTEAIVTGGIIEAATNSCTHDLKAKLDRQGIPATFNFRPTGVHTWSYWIDDVTASWPTIARGLGLNVENTGAGVTELSSGSSALSSGSSN